MSADPSITTAAVANWYGGNRMGASRVGLELAGCTHVSVGFAGGMGELLHIDARQLLVNDRHVHVINLASVMADPKLGPALYRRLRRKAFHPYTLAEAQKTCQQWEVSNSDDRNLFGATDETIVCGGHPDAKLDWAEAYFVSTWMNRGGGGGSKREFTGGLPVRFDAGGGGSAVRFFSAASSVVGWRRVLRRCEFTTLDVFEFIAHVKDTKEHGLYLDPPFPGPGDRYTHQLGKGGHARLAALAAGFKKTRVVMRFYDHPLVQELYPRDRWTWVEWQGRKQSNGDAPEVLLINGLGSH